MDTLSLIASDGPPLTKLEMSQSTGYILLCLVIVMINSTNLTSSLGLLELTNVHYECIFVANALVIFLQPFSFFKVALTE